MTNLSPAAQAVFHAFNSKFDWIEDGVPGPQFNAIAAALRAAAGYMFPNDTAQQCHDRILAIADELKDIS
jgi:hypothetical protein